jgi:hypothetical protein
MIGSTSEARDERILTMMALRNSPKIAIAATVALDNDFIMMKECRAKLWRENIAKSRAAKQKKSPD